jgi:ABC-type branched-subunit amino acid transport system ATPase component
VRPGRITALLGANGAGKSTLCKVAGGLLAPMAGRVLIGADTLDRTTAGRVFVAPEMRGVFPGLTVEDNLATWLPEKGQQDAALDRFDVLARRRKTPAGSLSGGEQQLLALAPAFIRRPEVLIADEPSLGLAPRAIDQIMSLFVELREGGVALLLVEEKPRNLLAVADEVAVLELGRVIWSGPPAELDEETVTHIYLGRAEAENKTA